jgi:hypothetical protein
LKDSTWNEPVHRDSIRQDLIRILEETPDTTVQTVARTPQASSVYVADPQDPGKPLRRESVAYLLEDNPAPRSGALYLILLLFFLVAALVLWQRRQDVSALFATLSGHSQISSAIPADKTQPETPAPPVDPPNSSSLTSLPSSRPLPSTTPAPASPVDRPDVTASTPAQPPVAANAQPSTAADHADENPALAGNNALEADGEKYLYGTDVPQDCSRAQRDLLMAAKANNSKAQTVLGTMYATGHCVGRDLPLAYHWFSRASQVEPNNAKIDQDLRLVWSQMSLPERQLALQAER